MSYFSCLAVTPDTKISGGLDIKAMPRVLWRLTQLSFRYPWRCFFALSCALAAAAFNLATPRLLGQAVDQAHHLLVEGHTHPEETRAAFLLLTTNIWGEAAEQAYRLVIEGHAHAVSPRAALLATALMILVACALRGALTGLHGYWGEAVAQRVGYDLRLAFFEKLQRLSFSFHDANHSGDLIARGMLDLEGIRAFLESGLLRSIVLLLVGVGAWRLLSVDVELGLIALSFVPFVAWRAIRMGLLLRLTWQRLQQLMSDLTLFMEENLQGVRVVRAFAGKSFELAKFDKAAQAALLLSNRRISLRMGSVSLMNFAYHTAMGLVLWVGGHRVGEGGMTVGALTEFLTFMTLLQQPIRQIGMIVNSSSRATSAGSRLFEVLDAVPDIRDAPGAKTFAPGSGVLRFESVDFAYSRGGRKILSDISFEVGPGKTLGIVGPPGSGKSTLAHLIPRFYDVSGGRITLDGQDIRAVTLDSLRRAVGLVQQEIFLFDATVHDNVAYAEPDADEPRVVEAASIAQIHQHVVRLPEAYATRVGERGVALSGGQRQRMSIARGLLAGRAIIVLDDSTAAIDAVTEQQVRASLRGTVRDRGAIIIAHRLGSLHHADEIIVLDEGKITQRGTHDELLRLGGTYAELWALQHLPDSNGSPSISCESNLALEVA
ncbi:ABC transporter ATP-binding protein [Candidatus Methylospira mobilis]|uniref:ABC transporter ATP-binding protein n=1 Tax=Candidatus Methylospira mobilis TaxID=1808979 RepID=A0A5Q0BKH8_9GAMM|nr:ABC transporter ATP-binding protein [Candidatus Methylospira mobilis]QFY42714.1 ABC transporter ATP-binding protein [Candidatus Methylospira mobilis]